MQRPLQSHHGHFKPAAMMLFSFSLPLIACRFSFFTFHFSLTLFAPFGDETWRRTYRGLRFAHPRLSMVGPLRGPSAGDDRAGFCSGLIK